MRIRLTTRIRLISQLNNVIQNGFRDTNYATQQQTCSLQNTIKDTTTINTNAILAKLDALSTSALQDKIKALRERNSEQATAINNSQQSALFAQIQERQRQEAENKALREEVNSLKEMFKEFMKSWQQ